ncbi:hypothetical protein EGR_06794 [Echinococcus granulosus]|uniref:Uncharacterized protein n=1 Tax=Echinococcus granulosus TaxID=6210 RepID=W6UJU4_ECHGR|nr:hypothetical protein EGR_06794 [Echinococcus granulosus]EUB58387.1 hypothetical protein EGR_06794 [Echinococcus granulosus]
MEMPPLSLYSVAYYFKATRSFDDKDLLLQKVYIVVKKCKLSSQKQYIIDYYALDFNSNIAELNLPVKVVQCHPEKLIPMVRGWDFNFVGVEEVYDAKMGQSVATTVKELKLTFTLVQFWKLDAAKEEKWNEIPPETADFGSLNDGK